MLISMIVLIMLGYYLGVKFNTVLKGIGIMAGKKIAIIGTLIICAILIATRSTFVGFIIYSLILFALCDILKVIIGLFEKENKVLNICRKIYHNGMLVIVLALIITIYGAYNAKNLKIKEYTITIDKALDEDVNIIMISDIHVGTSVKEHQIDNMLEKINEQNPDIVCLAGDIFDENSSDEMIEYLCEALGKIEVKYGIYYITGNHDGNMKDKFSDKFEKYNIYIIDEKAILINDSFYLVGRADDVTGNRGSVENILQGINKEYPIILLDHRPVNINEAENSGVDLQLSGHTHNGQIYPFNYFVGLANDVSYGHKKYGNYNIIVSSGYGTWGFPVRTGSSAEIVKVVLQGKS